MWAYGLKPGWACPSGPPWNSTTTGQDSPPGETSGTQRAG